MKQRMNKPVYTRSNLRFLKQCVYLDPMKPSDGFISMATENALCLKQLQPLLSNLGIRRDQLNRIKMNNTTPKSENIFTGYHIDCRPEWKGNGMTAIYYFNTTEVF